MNIGSRGSPLALCQAEWAKARLAAQGHAVEIRIIRTTGDKLANVPLAQSGTKGLFIKELEEALIEGAIDMAVHSLKDLPTDQPHGLVVAAVPEREDSSDVFVARNGQSFATLPAGSRIGTSSLRRQCQLQALRRDIEVLPLRGNLDTRLKKLDRGDYDGLVLAAAGLRRVGLAHRISSTFSVNEMCPAVGQGALAIEIRQGDRRIESAVRSLDHDATHLAVRAERATLRRLGGGCQVPIAAHAVVEGSSLRLLAVVANREGTKVIRAEGAGSSADPEAVGTNVAKDLLNRGAGSILESIHV